MHIHSCSRAALVACFVTALVAAPVSHAKPIVSELRVEAGGKALDPGNRYVNDTTTAKTSKSSACQGTGAKKTFQGPTGLGLLVHGADQNRRLRPVQISDQFEFGLFVCGVGGRKSGANEYWSFRVNHALSQVGAEQYALKPGDEVLWTYVRFSGGSNSGSELVLSTPDRTVRKGRPARVRVLAYDNEGKASPAAGVALTTGVTTGADGRAELRFDRAGRWLVRGKRGVDIATRPTAFCVWERSQSECDDVSLERTVGTDGGDTIAGTAVPETVLGQGGADTIDVRGGGADTVRCGNGRDAVRADRRDRVARDCEKVK